MSDALRFFDDDEVRRRCMDRVTEGGGAAFFERPGWDAELRSIAGAPRGRFETPEQRETAIVEELQAGRETLEDRLNAPVRYVCMPWGIGGDATRRSLARTGHRLAFADRLFGRRAVAAGDDPSALMRLHERFISCLPGRGRRFFFTAG
jgi:hypothetical protein